MENRAYDKQGFTLVEMALVLVVVGIVIGIGAGMIGPLMSLSKTRDTKEMIGATIESVNSWAASNNTLPNAAGFTAVAKSPNDAWGRTFIYLFDNTLYSGTPTKDTICGRKTTAISIINNGVSPAVTINNVAYLIVSFGDDAQINTTATDGPITISRTASGAVTLDPNISDIVRWVTLDELRSKIGCQGAQLKIGNNELPPGTVSAQYPNATAGSVLSIVTDGGATPGTLRWCIEAPSATPLPTGLAFNPSLAGAIRVAPNTCNAANPLPEANWIASPTLSISGIPAANSQGAYTFIVYARDNNDTAGTNDNIASKAFVLTINP